MVWIDLFGGGAGIPKLGRGCQYVLFCRRENGEIRNMSESESKKRSIEA